MMLQLSVAGVWVILSLASHWDWMLETFGPSKFLDFAGAWQNGRGGFNTAIAFVAVERRM